MINRTLALTRSHNLEMEEIRCKLLELIKNTNDDPYQICCGHDFVAIFSIALRNALGSKLMKAASPEALGIALRLAYDSEDFRQTKLYSDTRRWSNENQTYKIFL